MVHLSVRLFIVLLNPSRGSFNSKSSLNNCHIHIRKTNNCTLMQTRSYSTVYCARINRRENDKIWNKNFSLQILFQKSFVVNFKLYKNTISEHNRRKENICICRLKVSRKERYNLKFILIKKNISSQLIVIF